MSPENRLFILPGYSPKNKEWAEEVAESLKTDLNPTIVYWAHWTNETRDPNWVNSEAAKLKEQIGDQPINFIAKSVGSYVAVRSFQENPDLCKKLIICGLPGQALKLLE